MPPPGAPKPLTWRQRLEKRRLRLLTWWRTTEWDPGYVAVSGTFLLVVPLLLAADLAQPFTRALHLLWAAAIIMGACGLLFQWGNWTDLRRRAAEMYDDGRPRSWIETDEPDREEE